MRRGGRVGRGAAAGRARGRGRGPPGGAGRAARAAGRADDPRLRPLRRAAAGRCRRVDDAAVRAAAARRPHLRPRRDRRQGPGVRGPGDGPAVLRRAHRQVPDRGRGGDRQPGAAGVPARARRRAARRRRRVGGRSDVAAERAVGAGGGQGPARAGHRGRRAGVGPALGPPRRRRAEPAARAGRDPGLACTTRTGASRCRGSTTACGPWRSTCRSTRRPTSASVGVPALFGEPGFSTLERLWTRPTLEVNGCPAAARSP